MKKFLSIILASVILAISMISVSCFADTGVDQSNSSTFAETKGKEKGSSKVSSFVKFSLTAAATVLASAILLKEFSPEGNFGENAAKAFLKAKDCALICTLKGKDYIANLKQYVAGLCAERDADNKCVQTLGAGLTEAKHNISNEWNENISGPISNYWNNSKVVEYFSELWNALVNNFNSFVSVNETQANKVNLFDSLKANLFDSLNATQVNKVNSSVNFNTTQA